MRISLIKLLLLYYQSCPYFESLTPPNLLQPQSQNQSSDIAKQMKCNLSSLFQQKLSGTQWKPLFHWTSETEQVSEQINSN